MAHGGWCPQGRRSDDGAVPPRYSLKETPSERYPQRTEWNVRDSDATLIFTLTDELTAGSQLTANYAVKHRKPHLHVTPATQPDRLVQFLSAHGIRTLNVAGSRESSAPGIWQRVVTLLDAALDAGPPRG